MSGVFLVTGAPLTDFTYVSVKVRSLSMKIGLFSKTLMKTGRAQDHNVLAKKLKV